MKFERITVAPLAPALGAEVSRVDLSQPINDTTADEIRRAFADYLVNNHLERVEISAVAV